jgi:hypothetical protein
MNTIAMTTANTVVPFTQNPKQPQPKQQTAKEAIAANVQALIEQLEQGHSEGLTAYLTAMGRFHNYSFGNILEIARQRPDATRVAGLYAWNQLGRKVKKGERGSHPLMGRVIPDIRIGEGGTLRDAFVDGQFVLLDRSERSAFSATAEAWHKRVNVIRDGSASNGADLLALLARPDGVVVWAATTCAEADLQSLNENLVRWAGQPPSSVEVTPDAGN